MLDAAILSVDSQKSNGDPEQNCDAGEFLTSPRHLSALQTGEPRRRDPHRRCQVALALAADLAQKPYQQTHYRLRLVLHPTLPPAPKK